MTTRRRRRSTRRRRRIIPPRTTMKTLRALWKWAQKPHWTDQLTVASVVLAILVAWYLTGTFWRGVGAVVFIGAGWCVLRAVRWVEHRVRVTIEAGVPLSPWRMFKELRTEQEKYVDHDERWALFTRAQKIIYDGQQPKLHRKTMTAGGDVRAHVNMAGIGGNLDAIRRAASDGTLAGIMDCKEVSVVETSKLNRAWLTFYKNPPLERPVGLVDLPVSGPNLVSFGTDETGGPAAVAYGLSVLIVGETGSGKSKCGWNMFADILRDGKPTEMSVVDPKGTELAVFKPLVGKRVGNILIKDYIRTAQEAVPLFARFVDEMKARQDRNEAAGVRQLREPTEDMPARFVWVDEMNELQKAYKTIDAPMVTAISQGRSSLDWVVASVQVAKVSNLGDVRDQFPINVCFRTKTRENTKAALALEGENIPPCHMIPRSTPGVGYYVTEDGSVRKLRTSHVTDAQLDDLARGVLPDGMVRTAPVKYAGPPCFGYVGDDKVLGGVGYVGIAGGIGVEAHPVARRRAEHRRYDMGWCVHHQRVENWWKVHIDDRNLRVVKFPSRAAALIWEERQIKKDKPHWNIQHNGANPLSNFNLSKRAGMKTRMLDAASEWREVSREVQAVRQVKADFAKRDRVQAQVEKRDRFMANIGAGSMR